MTRGGGILNFVTSHFKNSIKVILHVSVKLSRHTYLSDLCCICGLYFASYKATNLHKQSHKRQQVLSIAKIHPQRIVARRAIEILCLNDDNDAL